MHTVLARSAMLPGPADNTDNIDHFPAKAFSVFSISPWKSSAAAPKSAYIFQAILTRSSSNGSVCARLRHHQIRGA